MNGGHAASSLPLSRERVVARLERSESRGLSAGETGPAFSLRFNVGYISEVGTPSKSR